MMSRIEDKPMSAAEREAALTELDAMLDAMLDESKDSSKSLWSKVERFEINLAFFACCLLLLSYVLYRTFFEVKSASAELGLVFGLVIGWLSHWSKARVSQRGELR